jgi:hypothetical protein
MTSQEIPISSSVPTETVMQPLTLHLTRGVLASTIDETRGMHNAFVDEGTQPGREIARALGDLSHNVYAPARGVDPALRAQPGELLFVDYWAAASGTEMFFSNPVALGAADQLFSSREESEWAVAPDGFGFSVPARHGAPPRFVAITRAAIRSADEAVPAMGKLISAGLPAARRRGQISHGLFIRDAGIANRRPAANTRRAHGNTLAQSAAQAEVLALDGWSTVDGLAEHYRDATVTGGLPDALIGPAETAVWQQEAGFSEW